MENKRVAICQPYIILGGRLQVILGMVRALNQLGIEPDILTLGTSFDPQKIGNNYGQDLRAHFRIVLKIFPWRYVPQDLQILIFNALLKRIGSGYDLIIDSSNSQIFLPEIFNILSYVHFPREWRLASGFSSSSQPKPKTPFDILQQIFYRIINILYQWNKRTPKHQIICNSFFTRQSLLRVYPDLTKQEIEVIYPPVDTSLYKNSIYKKSNAVVTLGRFAPDKEQLDQIKIGRALPDLTFHLIGFVSNKKYFEKCKTYIQSNGIINVILYPDASLNDVISLLKSSKYFLHLLVDEPFGVTAVQAIAAGCIPLVHDSGGQRETVPIAELRFTNLEQIPKMISTLENRKSDEIENIVLRLQKNAEKNFDQKIFDEKITSMLKVKLKIN
jgi:glycosyltransferase involved in cell wall biosynthesis